MRVHDRAGNCLGNMDAKITLHFLVKKKKVAFQGVTKKKKQDCVLACAQSSAK